MKDAGINVVRMGESTWSLWEPEDGKFEYAWMDRVVDAMGKAGIKVILGTPTYSVPAWMSHPHPEILADRIPAMFGGKACPASTACARTWTPTSPPIASTPSASSATWSRTTATTQTLIGWQLDNETASTAPQITTSLSVSQYLKQNLTTDDLNKAWGLNYWGQNIHTWEDLPTREGTISTGYKLEWSRWSQMRVTDFLHWQAALVRECAGSRQFVTTDYGGMMKQM